MLKKPNSKKIFLIIIAVVIILALIYFYFSGGQTVNDTGTLLTQPTNEVDIVGSKVLNLLNQIQSLKIDQTFFTSAAYKTLQDYSVAIPQENVGRANPFAPIPGVVSPGAQVNQGSR